MSKIYITGRGTYPYWKKNEASCPICRGDSCEYLIDLDDESEEVPTKERCKKGCFVVDIP